MNFASAGLPLLALPMVISATDPTNSSLLTALDSIVGSKLEIMCTVLAVINNPTKNASGTEMSEGGVTLKTVADRLC